MEHLYQINKKIDDTADISQVREFAEMSAAIANVSNIGLFVLDLDSSVKFWNQWMVDCSGVSAQVAMGRSLQEIFPNLAGVRLLHAINDCLVRGMSSVLSQTLNPHVYLYISHRQSVLVSNLCHN